MTKSIRLRIGGFVLAVWAVIAVVLLFNAFLEMRMQEKTYENAVFVEYEGSVCTHV